MIVPKFQSAQEKSGESANGDYREGFPIEYRENASHSGEAYGDFQQFLRSSDHGIHDFVQFTVNVAHNVLKTRRKREADLHSGNSFVQEKVGFVPEYLLPFPKKIPETFGNDFLQKGDDKIRRKDCGKDLERLKRRSECLESPLCHHLVDFQLRQIRKHDGRCGAHNGNAKPEKEYAVSFPDRTGDNPKRLPIEKITRGLKKHDGANVTERKGNPKKYTKEAEKTKFSTSVPKKNLPLVLPGFANETENSGLFHPVSARESIVGRH